MGIGIPTDGVGFRADIVCGDVAAHSLLTGGEVASNEAPRFGPT